MSKKIVTEASKRLYVAPSILSADFACLGKEIISVEKAGCDWIHIDVMDGHFVPNITIGPVVVKGIRKVTRLPLDVHLMISEPNKYIPAFIEAGADYVTFHYEAYRNYLDLFAQIRHLGARAGISIKPNTLLGPDVLKAVRAADLVLVMTVEPGFGGQAFMRQMVSKITTIRQKYKGLISVDGGIDDQTAKEVIEAGADVLVSGSYVFRQRNRKKALQSLRVGLATQK